MAISLRKETYGDLVRSLQRYFREEHGEELTDLKARLLLDYIIAEVGPSVYNQAIEDAQGWLQERVQDLDGACHEPELPYWNRRRPGPR